MAFPAWPPSQGVLDLDEFYAMMDSVTMMTHRPPYSRPQLNAIFRGADKDGNGTIDFYEFILLQQEKARESDGASSDAGLSDLLGEFDEATAEAMLIEAAAAAEAESAAQGDDASAPGEAAAAAGAPGEEAAAPAGEGGAPATAASLGGVRAVWGTASKAARAGAKQKMKELREERQKQREEEEREAARLVALAQAQERERQMAHENACAVFYEEVLEPVLEYVWDVVAEEEERLRAEADAESERRRREVMDRAEAQRAAARREAARRTAERREARARQDAAWKAEMAEREELSAEHKRLHGVHMPIKPAMSDFRPSLRQKRNAKLAMTASIASSVDPSGMFTLSQPPSGVANRYPHAARLDGADRAFRIFDADASGAIDVSELGEALNALGLQTDSEQAAAVLARYDSDESGVLEHSEFKRLVLELRDLSPRDEYL